MGHATIRPWYVGTIGQLYFIIISRFSRLQKLGLCLGKGNVTLQAEPFLTVHILCTEKKALHESCQLLVEHAQGVAKIRFGTQAESVFILKTARK